MSLPVPLRYPPMLADAALVLPRGGWHYEPKWDGLRCLAFRDGQQVELRSKSGEPLTRYFPELALALGALRARRFVLDGVLAVPLGGGLSFEALLQRIAPAESLVERLSRETPALLLAFDLLVDPSGGLLVERPFAERRAALEAFAAAYLGGRPQIQLSPATRSREVASAWLESGGAALDGVVAKKLDAPYASGGRGAMRTVQLERSADCVVGGLRWSADADGELGALLLGLYGDDKLLHHVGFATSFGEASRPAVLKRVRGLVGNGGFTGRAPGAPSRWGGERAGKWEPVQPELVVEVRYDHWSDGRFRHPTRLVRFRSDKPPKRCTFAQLDAAGGESPLSLLQPLPPSLRAKTGRAARLKPSRRRRSPRAARSRRS
jgi:ATP-dependent DNA ligase